MKRVLAIIILGFALSYPLSSTSHAADPYIGQGEVKLSYNTIRNFKEYVRNNAKRPSAFLITIDGIKSVLTKRKKLIQKTTGSILLIISTSLLYNIIN